MKTFVRSLVTAGCFAVAVWVFVGQVIAPEIPPHVGPPDFATERSLQLPSAKRVVVDAQNGAIRVHVAEAGAERGCLVQSRIRLYSLDEKHPLNLAALAPRLVTAEHVDGTLRIRSLPPDWPDSVAAYVDYDVTIPRGTDIDIDGVNGNVWVAEGCGEVRIESTNADVEVRGPEGPVVARSTNGRLRLWGAREPSTLETVNGDIDATVEGGALSATSVNGHVRADVLAPSVRACVLKSENGNVGVSLADAIGFTVNASARRGRVIEKLQLERESAGAGSLSARAGDGGTLLTLTTANGNIRLARK